MAPTACCTVIQLFTNHGKNACFPLMPTQQEIPKLPHSSWIFTFHFPFGKLWEKRLSPQIFPNKECDEISSFLQCKMQTISIEQFLYLLSLIPPERQISYDLRNPQAYAQNRARIDCFSNSYFHNTSHEWNKLPIEIRASKSIAEFKRKLIALIRPIKNTIYGVSDLKGIRNITKLRVQFSDLNGHKFHHNFECLRPICNCGMASEDNEHYLLHCPSFNQWREDLFGTVTEVSGIDTANLDSETLCNLLLYGSSNMNMIENRIIIEATIEYIEKINRLK